MTLQVKNTRDLIDPDNIKLKCLLIGPHGVGKTTWMATAPNVGVGVTETGHGKGLMSVVASGLDYIELSSYEDMEAFCGGQAFKEKDTLALDSLSEMARTFIKAKALSMPGASPKRALGIPELQDWGVIAELTRKLTRKIIEQEKHIITTAGLRIDKMDENNPMMLQGPDLSGAMFMGSTAMFDLVLQMRVRSMLRDPKDAKSRYLQRYFITQSDGGGILAKNRLSVGGGSFLPEEVPFDLKTGEGNFMWFLNRAKEEYSKYLKGGKK